jgi:hypothetical protein
VNPSPVPAAKAPRIAIMPTMPGHSDAIELDEQKNVVTCPVPYDGSFIQVFNEGWRIVQALCASDFEMPGPSEIPSPLHREVARVFVERREFPIGDVLEAIRMFAQPGLLTSSTGVVSNVPFGTTALPATSVMITPIARTSVTPQIAHEELALPLTEQRAPW